MAPGDSVKIDFGADNSKVIQAMGEIARDAVKMEAVLKKVELTGDKIFGKKPNLNANGFIDLKQMSKNKMLVNEVAETFDKISKSPQIAKGGFEVDSFLNLDEFKKQAYMFSKELDDTFKTTKNIPKLEATKGGFKADEFLSLDEFKKQAQMFGKTIDDTFKTTRNIVKTPYVDKQQIANMKIIAAETANMDKVLKVMNKEVKKGKSQMASWAMSIMFFGMAIKGALESVWRSSSKTFNDAAHSVEGTVTGFDTLNASTSYLGYTIGAALEPIAAWLAPLIIMFADWVSENEDLVRVIFSVLYVFSSLLFIWGTLRLAWDGLVGAWKAGKDAINAIKKAWTFITDGSLVKALKDAWGWIVKIGEKMWAWAVANWGVIAPLLLIIAIIAVIVALAITFRYAWKQVLDGFILKWKYQWTYLQQFAAWFAMEIAKWAIIFSNFGLNLKLMFIGLWDDVKIGFANAVNWVIDEAQKLIIWLNSAMGDYSPFAGLNLDAWKIDTATLVTPLSAEDQAALDKQTAMIEQLTNAYDEYALMLEHTRWELEAAMEANQNLGLDNIKKSWQEVLDWIKGGVKDTTDSIVPSMPTIQPTDLVGTETGNTVDNSTNIYNLTISPQMEGESQEDYAKRLYELLSQRGVS